MNDHGKTTAAFESIAAGLGRGLIYIQEDYNIGAYSNLAKEITGIRLPAHSQGHDGGNIEEGDIVVTPTTIWVTTTDFLPRISN